MCTYNIHIYMYAKLNLKRDRIKTACHNGSTALAEILKLR